jgi:hypothetical protein
VRADECIVEISHKQKQQQLSRLEFPANQNIAHVGFSISLKISSVVLT